MLVKAENINTFKFNFLKTEAKLLPPAAASMILYGARDMSKLKFYLDGIKQYANYFSKVFFIAKALFRFTSAKKYAKPTCLVATSRSSLKALQLQKQFNICYVSISILNLPFLLKRRINFVELSPVKAHLDQVFEKQLDAVCPSLTDEFNTEEYLASNNFNCFIYDTPTTLNNFLAYFFKKQGKKVIYLQHGIYQLKNYELDAATKNFANGFVVWGEAFKNLFIRNGVAADRIRVGCINKSVKKSRNYSADKNICFLGLPLTKFSDEVREEALVVIRRTNEACVSAGYEMVYKPHPMENIADTKQRFAEHNIHVRIISVKQNLQNTLNKYNFFIGFYSTGLIEASMLHKKALQILMQTKDYDDFNALGICRSVKSDSKELDKVIRELIEERTVTLLADSEYIRHSEYPGIRYKQCIQSLIEDKEEIISKEKMYA